MQQLTPQQNAATAKNVQALMSARENAVKTPFTKGTFANTADGWVNTTAGGWTSNPRRENYSLFSVKWGPATQAFPETEETAESIEGRSHLYLYLGVDRCAARYLQQGDRQLTWNALHVDGHAVDYVILADVVTDSGQAWAWKKVITPDMLEPNWPERSGATVNDYGTILPVTSAPTPYTGWVETPWTKYSGEPVVGMYWRVNSVPGAEEHGGYALVLSRCQPQYNLMFSSIVGHMNVDFTDDNGTLKHTTIRLVEPVSQPTTIFDEIPTDVITADMSQGIAQGHTGSLTLDRGLTKAPFYAVRSHIFCGLGLDVRLIPGMLVPLQGQMQVELDGVKYLSWSGMRFRGNDLYIRGYVTDQQEQAAVKAGVFSWDSFVTSHPQTALWTNTPVYGGQNPLGAVYLPEMKLETDPETWLFTTTKLDILARVVYHREHAIYFIQWWCPNVTSEEPGVPADGTPATDWFQWGRLDQPLGYRNMIWRPTDGVMGRLDFTDIQPDSWYALSVNGAFASIGRTDDIYGDEMDSYATAIEIYNFSDLDYKKETIEAGDEYLVRHRDGDRAVLQYAPLSTFTPNVDTLMPLSVDQNSIDYAELSSDSYLQLYKFPDNQRIDEKTALSDTTDAVLRHRYISAGQQIVEVDYIDADAVINQIPDADRVNAATKSLETSGTDFTTGRAKLQMYKFNDSTYRTDYADIKGYGQFLVRAGGILRYVPADQLSGGGLSGEVSCIGDVQYDLTSHQLQKRVDVLDLATGQVTQGQWTMIQGGQAVAHSTLHPGGV